MIYASEFPEVQKSLGIEVTSEISEKPYADADRAAIASGRLEILEAPHPANAQMNMWGAFVDGQLKVLRANGNTIVLHNKDDEYKSKAAKIFGK